jgi:hypothetical protein
MGAKLKSKTHLLNTFFDFLSRFLRIRLQSLQKVLIWPPKIFFWKKSEKISKNAEFHADLESVEKVVKKCNKKKVISKKSLTNMSKKWKKGFFPSHFANNFFMLHFFKTFSTDLKSAWNSAFFDTHIEFFNKKSFLLLLALFVNFDCKCAGNGSKKRKIFFYECVLDFN